MVQHRKVVTEQRQRSIDGSWGSGSTSGSVILPGVGKELLEEQRHQVLDRLVKLEDGVLVTLPEDGVIVVLVTAGVIGASPAVGVIVELRAAWVIVAMFPDTGVLVKLATAGVIVVEPPC